MSPPTAYRLPPTNRAGISLMEVLISIGIMAIGMVSIASLLPVGGIYVERANIEERKAELGQNSFREFQIRGMGNIANWARANGTPYSPLNLGPVNNPADLPYLPTVAIDPLMVAFGGGVSVDAFPATYSNVGPRMKRLTVAAANNATPATAKTLAESIFTLTDDLVVDQPDDRTLPATGRLDSSNSKRDYEGLYTWMATLAPRFPQSVLITPTANSIQPPASMDQFILSIVVFNRRLLAKPVAASGDQGQEEIVEVTSVTTTSLNTGGGEFVMSDNSANAQDKLGMARPTQWIMLCRYRPYLYVDSSGTSYSVPWVESNWYRVVAAGDITDAGSGTFTRAVTLAGPDWGPNSTSPAGFSWPNASVIPIPSQNFKTYACLFDGAVAVYQRVIHLDGPSVWSQ